MSSSAARLIMVQGVSSNAGKSIFTGALCRFLVARGVRVAPFKPLLVCGGGVEENGVPTDTRFLHSVRAARLPLDSDMNPMQILPVRKDWLGQVMSPASLRWPDGTSISVPLFGRDTPSFGELASDERARVRDTASAALERLRASYDVIVIEGAGNPTDLGEGDLTNHEIVARFRPPTVLITKLSAGGGGAALLGTVALLSREIRESLVGFVLNDFIGGRAVAEELRTNLVERTGLPCLGILPNLWQIAPWSDKEAELDGLANLVAEHIDVAALGL